MRAQLPSIGLHGTGRPTLTYEEARDLARHPDGEVRRRLAQRQDVRPEILYYLAEDASPDVRLEIAANAATPPKADLVLAYDADDRVRCELAGKIANLVPHLSPEVQSRLRDITIEVLEILARDQVSRVRQILAETLKDVGHAPPHVIQWLARDLEIDVAAPVLQFSPLLTDSDLLEIIESAPVQGALAAIARRRGLSAELCAVLAESEDRSAVTDLLGNSSAELRDEVLNHLADRSRAVTVWQAPLVWRPRLPGAIARKLASFVADSLLSVLMQRKDLPPDVVQDVAAAVHRRIADETQPESSGAEQASEQAALAPASGGKLDRFAMRKKGAMLAQYVQQLYAKGELDEAAVAEALAMENEEFVTRALAFRAGVAPTLVSRVVAARSAKGITALAWKAGLSMGFAVTLQVHLAHIAPGDVLTAKEEAAFPLAPDEMNRLIRSFGEQAPTSRPQRVPL